MIETISNKFDFHSIVLFCVNRSKYKNKKINKWKDQNEMEKGRRKVVIFSNSFESTYVPPYYRYHVSQQNKIITWHVFDTSQECLSGLNSLCILVTSSLRDNAVYNVNIFSFISRRRVRWENGERAVSRRGVRVDVHRPFVRGNDGKFCIKINVKRIK